MAPSPLTGSSHLVIIYIFAIILTLTKFSVCTKTSSLCIKRLFSRETTTTTTTSSLNSYVKERSRSIHKTNQKSAAIPDFPYYYDPRIHNFGNIGPMGMLHAEIAPFVTWLIDARAYYGENVRRSIMEPYIGKYSVCDLACGVGTSTIVPGSVGVDTSPRMLNVAARYNNKSKFVMGNAESFGKSKAFDMVTCMFAFHEMPSHAHRAILENAIRIARKEVLIVDICPSYKPSATMLTGEPYVLNYLATIRGLMKNYGFKEYEHVQNRVTVWRLAVRPL